MKTVPNFFIDKITNSIEEKSSGKKFETEMMPITEREIRSVFKKDGWLFDWKREFKEPGHQLYKLVLIDDSSVQGLISFESIPDQLYVRMHLIENAPHNNGKKKRFIGVAGNMVAFVCKMSFELGFEGVVTFTAKTKLINHYVQTLGAQVIYSNNRMAIFTEASKKLVNSYYNNYFND